MSHEVPPNYILDATMPEVSKVNPTSACLPVQHPLQLGTFLAYLDGVLVDSCFWLPRKHQNAG